VFLSYLLVRKDNFFIYIEKLLDLLLFLLSLKVLAWVVCLSLYNLVFFFNYLEFFLESELHVFFQVLFLLSARTLKIKVLRILKF
jgi:hypothetical protein